MTYNERTLAITMLQDLVDNKKYFLMQYKNAAEMVDRYNMLPFKFWQDLYNNFNKAA